MRRLLRGHESGRSDSAVSAGVAGVALLGRGREERLVPQSRIDRPPGAVSSCIAGFSHFGLVRRSGNTTSIKMAQAVSVTFVEERFLFTPKALH